MTNRGQEIFARAYEMVAEDRETFLSEECGSDVELRQEVERLLADASRADSFFGSDHGATLAADGSGKSSGKPSGSAFAYQPSSQTEKEGDIIGSYKLLQQIGEGGFGTVWMAEQSEPISRRVALKVIKAGMDTKEVLTRFEAERQAVAMMDHSNIAKVLDAGATESGRPFFAMELVKGVPINQFCDEQKLDTRQRLALFGDVCSAINHAHQKGVIHRDIKPSNVMVTLQADKPVVKVIDFGIAKATHSKLTDKTLLTRFDQFMGTPAYMSPEQAGLSGLDIDTRSDIYSLGVLLYELLAGRPPFDPKTLISAGYEEMRRIIREEEPPRPSHYLSTTSGEEADRINGTHGTEPRKLSRLVRGELDWIVMKALEKDRSRRYETANAFVADIDRYLSNEPVQAAAPSAGYRFRKFARRNKAAIGTVALVAFVLIAATGVSTWQAIEAHRARIQSEKDKEEAEAISTYMVEVFQSPDPARDGRTITVAETLDSALKKLETDLVDQPDRRAGLLQTLGQTYHSLGLLDESIPVLEEAKDLVIANLGPEHPDTLALMTALAFCYSKKGGRLDDAIKMQERVLELSLKVLAPNDLDTLVAWNNLALSYHSAGRHEDALAIREKLVPLYAEANVPPDKDPGHMFKWLPLSNLAQSYQAVGRYDDAREMLEEALNRSASLNGGAHPSTIMVKLNLSGLYSAEGQEKKALEVREECLNQCREVYGEDHPQTLMAMAVLANSYEALGSHEKAISLQEKVLTIFREKNRTPDVLALSTFGSLANTYVAAEQREKALQTLEEAAQISRSVNKPEYQYLVLKLGIFNNLARQYSNAGRESDAIKFYKEALEFSEEINEGAFLLRFPVMAALASAYEKTGRNDKETRDFWVEFFTLSRKQMGIHHPHTAAISKGLVNAYRRAGRIEELGEVLAEHAEYLRRNGIGSDSEVSSQCHRHLQECAYELTKGPIPKNHIELYYSENRESLRESPVRLHLIVIKEEIGKDRKEQRRQAEALCEKIAGGAVFAEVAREYSPESYSDGGDRGPVDRGTFKKGLERAIFSAKSGAPEIYEDEEGVYILMTDVREKGRIPPLGEIQDEIEGILRTQKRDELITEWQAEASKRSEKNHSFSSPEKEDPSQDGREFIVEGPQNSSSTGPLNSTEPPAFPGRTILALAIAAVLAGITFLVYLRLKKKREVRREPEMVLLEAEQNGASSSDPHGNKQSVDPEKRSSSKKDHPGDSCSGIASFTICALVLLLSVLLLSLFYCDLLYGEGVVYEQYYNVIDLGFLVLVAIMALVSLCLGITSLVRKERRKLWAILGTISSCLYLFGSGALIIYSLLQGEGGTLVESHRQAIERDPGNAELHEHLGFALLQEGKLDEAIEAYQRSVTLDPNLAVAHSALGEALGRKGQMEEAIQSLRRAVEISPKPGFYFNLASALSRQGDLDEAIKNYRQGLAHYPGDATVFNNFGYTLFKNGETEEAIDFYQRAIQLDPGNVLAHHNLGNAWYRMGERKQAIESIRSAIELEPTDAKAHNWLGFVLSEAGELDQAIASLGRAIELDPEDAKAHNSLGFALFQQGDTEEAIASYRRAIELDPGNSQAMVNLATGLAKLGKIDRCGIWIVRFLLSKGIADEAALVKQIPLAFRELSIDFPAAESPSDESIVDYYENHAESFTDTSVRLRMISAPKSKNFRVMIESLRKELAAGGDFAAAALEHSDDSVKDDGGDRGWIKRGDLNEDLTKVALSLKAGQVSEVIEDATHYRILKVEQRKEGEVIPLSEVRDQIIKIMMKEAPEARIEGWIEEARKELKEK